jgi:hypothetical protein
MLLDPFQQIGFGEFEVFESSFDVDFAFAVDKSRQTKALDESFYLGRRHRLLLQIDEVNSHAPLFEEPLGGSSVGRVFHTENLHTQHMVHLVMDIVSTFTALQG